MKRIIYFLFYFCIILQNVKGLDASIAISTFKTYNNNYIEVYAQIAASTIKYKTTDSINYKALIEVIYVIKQKDSIVAFDKFVLDATAGKFASDLLDTKRFPLKNGKYQLEATFKNLNKIGNDNIYMKKYKVNIN